MEEGKKPGSKEIRLRIDPEKFAAAMDRLATDEKLQEKLDNQPMEALEELGIEIDKEIRVVLKGKSLAEIMGVTKEEMAVMQLMPAAVIKPVALAPKSRVISAVGGVTMCMPVVPCVKIHANPFIQTGSAPHIRAEPVPTPAPLPRAATTTQAKAEKKSESE
jgi:hypothetical protein